MRYVITLSRPGEPDRRWPAASSGEARGAARSALARLDGQPVIGPARGRTSTPRYYDPVHRAKQQLAALSDLHLLTRGFEARIGTATLRIAAEHSTTRGSLSRVA